MVDTRYASADTQPIREPLKSLGGIFAVRNSSNSDLAFFQRPRHEHILCLVPLLLRDQRDARESRLYAALQGRWETGMLTVIH